MKLSLATAALLGQTAVPVLSMNGPRLTRDPVLSTEILKATPFQSILEYDDMRGLRSNRRLIRQMARNLKNTPRGLKAMFVPCDPRSTDADIGLLSCGTGYTCEPSIASSLGGVCTALEDQELGRDSILPWKGPLVNHPSAPTQGTDAVPCDPTSIDIGILVCGGGQICTPDKTSELGGLCVDSLTYDNRRLTTYDFDEALIYCGSYPPEDPILICDCSGVNMTSRTGTVYCTQNFTASLIPGCDEYVVYDAFEYSFKDSVFEKGHDCYVTKTPFMEEICFFYYMKETEPFCYAEWNGQRCTSCVTPGNYGIPAFDCSNVDGGRVGNTRKDLLSVFDSCANSTCTNVCGDGYFIPDFNSDIIIADFYNNTCGFLATYEEKLVIFDDYCPYFVEAAQSGDCCVPISSGEDGATTPGPEPTDNPTIPAEDDEEGGEESSPPPDGDTENDSASAYQTIASMASMTIQAVVVMVLFNRN